jgi:glycosyltransferase involved in cell wall biosynthesis
MLKPRYNIAHILPWSSIGGTEHATLRIASATRGDEFEHIAFHLEGASVTREMFADAGFDTAAYRAVEPSYRRPKKFLRAAFQLSRELKRQDIDLVHCADLLAGHYASVAGKLARLPVLCHIRNRFEVVSRRDQSFLHPIDKFAFVSKDTWKHFGYKVSARRGTVVYDGIELSDALSTETGQDVRRELNIPADAHVIGMVARVAPQKDYATLAKAAARVVALQPNTRFLIVGDNAQVASHNEHFEEVKRMLEESGVTPYFVFAGFREDVPCLISAFDIFVLSTHWEGLPLVILEAMAQAKPVIATNVDGIPEIVLNEKTGLLHRHEDDEQLAAQILSLLEQKDHAAQLGEAGRAFVRAQWSRERFAKDMKSLYHEMLIGKYAKADKITVGDLLESLEEK